MKKKFLPISIVFLFSLLFFLHPVGARAETITDFRTKVTVNSNATIRVEEKIAYDFGALERHGIYRDIPTHKVNSDGKRFRTFITVQSVTDENGAPYNYTTSYTGPQDDLRIKIGDANVYVSGLKTYVITYDVKGAITYFSDHDELYWNMTGNSWNVPIEKASYEVLLPQNVPTEQVRQQCYTGVTGSKSSLCQTAPDNGSWSGSATGFLASGEGLTAVVGFPPGHVAYVEPQPVINFADTMLGKLVLILLGLLAVIWYVGLPVFVPVFWLLWGRDPKSTTGPVSAWFDPPQNKAGRKLTPGETGLLIDENVDMSDIFATVIHLAQRGYLKIVEKKKNDFYFVKQRDYMADATLLDFEGKLLEGIFSGSKRVADLSDVFSLVSNAVSKTPENKDEVRIKSLNMGEEVIQSTNMLYAEMTKSGFFPKNPQTVRTVWYVLGGVALMTGNIILGIELFIFGRIMPKKTQFGREQANVAISLKNFLSTQERQLEFQARNQMFFEKLLPYAIAFGVEKVWADRFKDIQLHAPDWYQPYDSRAFTAAYLLGSMNSSFSNFRSAATPTRSSSGFSSGFGGGGFSGGGGGGGGGGSW